MQLIRTFETYEGQKGMYSNVFFNCIITTHHFTTKHHLINLSSHEKLTTCFTPF